MDISFAPRIPSNVGIRPPNRRCTAHRKAQMRLNATDAPYALVRLPAAAQMYRCLWRGAERLPLAIFVDCIHCLQSTFCAEHCVRESDIHSGTRFGHKACIASLLDLLVRWPFAQLLACRMFFSGRRGADDRSNSCRGNFEIPFKIRANHTKKQWPIIARMHSPYASIDFEQRPTVRRFLRVLCEENIQLPH